MISLSSRLGSVVFLLFFKQKTAYEMRISDWSSDVCSSDLGRTEGRKPANSRRPTAGNSGYDAGVRGSGFRPASMEDAEARYLQLKTRAARQRRARIEAFAETDIRPCVIEDIDSGFTGQAFPKQRRTMEIGSAHA